MSDRGNGILRFLDYWAGIPLCLLSAAIRQFHISIPLRNAARAAILCQGAIGDALLLSALIQSLHNKFPRLQMDLFLSRSNGQVAELLPHVHSALVFPLKNPLPLIAYLRRQKYDLLFDASQWTRLGAIISAVSGAKYTVGFKSPGQMRHFAYDEIVSHSDKIHEKDNFLALGKALWNELEGDCVLVIPEWQGDKGLFDEGRFICLHMWPSGFKSWLKEWPEERWRELCERLLGAGYKLALTGGPSDKEKTEDFIKRNFMGAENIYSLAGKYRLGEMAAIMQKADALVSVNTGIMHLGALAGLPVVGLHGPTNPLRWGPLGNRSISLLPHAGRRAYLDLGFEYPLGAENTMGTISVDEVVEALKRLRVKME